MGRELAKESAFVTKFLDKIRKRYPEAIIMKNDANQIQGFPDWDIKHMDKWVSLEFKRSKNASKQPNQAYWVDTLNKMSYASFVYPENEEEVLYEIQRVFES